MPTSPGPLLQALDALWDRLRASVPELPVARIVVSPTKSRASHGPEMWNWESEGIVSGLVVSADVLADGPEATLDAVLHAGAHVLCWVRGDQDTTMRGTYHNQTFLSAAQEVGLEWREDKPRVQGRGYSTPELSDCARSRYAEDLSALADAIPLTLPHLSVHTPERSTQYDRIGMECKCDPPRKFRIAGTVAAKGPITCGVCEEEFRSA